MLLCTSQVEKRPFQLLLVRTYLGMSQYQRAKSLLKELESIGPLSVEDQELLAAALIGLKEFEAAKSLLETLPSTGKGGGASAPLSYLKSRDSLVSE